MTKEEYEQTIVEKLKGTPLSTEEQKKILEIANKTWGIYQLEIGLRKLENKLTFKLLKNYLEDKYPYEE